MSGNNYHHRGSGSGKLEDVTWRGAKGRRGKEEGGEGRKGRSWGNDAGNEPFLPDSLFFQQGKTLDQSSLKVSAGTRANQT